MASNDRKASTINLSGSDYAKVAERLRLFRNDFPKSKTESAYEYDVDETVVFTVWLWKDKIDLIELMKTGVTDKEILRSSSDANGTAKSKGKIGAKDKDFEKLETIALGRALGMMGYLASGEIASFEEQQEFEKFRAKQQQEAIADIIKTLDEAKDMDALKKAFVASKMMDNALIVAAKDKRKREIESEPVDDEPVKPKETKPEQPNEAN